MVTYRLYFKTIKRLRNKNYLKSIRSYKLLIFRKYLKNNKKLNIKCICVYKQHIKNRSMYSDNFFSKCFININYSEKIGLIIYLL